MSGIVAPRPVCVRLRAIVANVFLVWCFAGFVAFCIFGFGFGDEGIANPRAVEFITRSGGRRRTVFDGKNDIGWQEVVFVQDSIPVREVGGGTVALWPGNNLPARGAAGICFSLTVERQAKSRDAAEIVAA